MHFNTKFIILLTTAKLATLGLLKIKVFWNEGCYIISVHDVTNKISPLDLNYIVDAVIWTKFGNSGISMKGVNITLVL